MEKKQGIILKVYAPKCHKLSLFDRQLGRIECGLVRSKVINTLSSGFFVYYTIEHAKNFYMLDNLEIAYVPWQLARYDIQFFHHILELCYFFLSEGSVAPHIYDLITFFLNSPTFLPYSLFKKIVVLRFFTYLGIYPETYGQLPTNLHYWLYEPLDKLKYDIACAPIEHTMLEQWIVTCIEAHPHVRYFKTISIGRPYDLYK